VKDSFRKKSPLSLKANMLWNSVGSTVYLGFQWLITIAVVRLSDGYDAAGALALGMAVSNIFSPIGQYKVRAYQVSDVEGEFSLGQYIGLRVITCVIALIVMVVYGLATCPVDSLSVVYLYGIYSFGPIVVDVLHGEDQRQGRMDVIGKSLIQRGIISFFSFCMVFALSSSLDFALIAMCVTTFSVIAFYDCPRTRRIAGSLKPDMNLHTIRCMLQKFLPAVVALLFCSAVPTIPRQILGMVSGSEVLGVYSSVAAPVLIIQMGAQYVYAPMLTQFAKLYAGGNVSGFWRLFAKLSVAVLGIAIAGILFFLIFGEQLLLLLYSASIVPYTYTLPPLVVCTVITAYIWFIGDLFIAVRDLRGNLKMFSVSIAICCFSMVPLVEKFGMNGVSYCIIISFGLAVAIMLPRLRNSASSKYVSKMRESE
jgi:O-antigen/teichoic acid export membrane protein